jgi:hypothetical protein
MKKIRLLSVILTSLLIICTCNNPKPGKVSASHEEMMKNSSRTEKNGWINIHLEGAPEVIGYQHGYLLADEIMDLRGAMSVLNEKTTGRAWTFYRDESTLMFWDKIPEEYQKEIDGIVTGVNAKKGEGSIMFPGSMHRVIPMLPIRRLRVTAVPSPPPAPGPKTARS